MNKYACTFFFNKSEGTPEDNIVCVCTPGYTLFVPGIFYQSLFSHVHVKMLRYLNFICSLLDYIYYYYIPISLALCKD